MRALVAPLTLVVASARLHPARWLATVLGVALATAFACGVAAEATIAGDQAARAVLRAAPPLEQTVRLTAQGQGSAARERRARLVLAQLGVKAASRVILLNPVRLDGMLVRPAAIAPLTTWVGSAAAAALGSCSSTACPVLLSRRLGRPALTAYGVTLRVAGVGSLSSAVPLGFAPNGGGGPPVALASDPTGLDRIGGLSGVYRTESWVSPLSLSRLHSWQLGGLEARLQRGQAALPPQDGFALTAPFDLIDSARTQAAAAPRRLLLTGGGSLAALAVFIILAAYALRHERAGDVRRLAAAGARASQRVVFAVGEAGLLTIIGLVFGAAVGVIATAVLATSSHLPVVAVLTRTLLTWSGLAVLAGGWAVATALVSLVLLLPSARIADVLAIAAAAALALALTQPTSGTLPALVAPLVCATAGALIYRVAVVGLRGLERLSRAGPPVLRLAVIGLARAPAAPALAIAFVAVSTGLGGFALGYRATLERGQADAAANRVPLDALVAPGPSFATPLELASLRRWRALAGGHVLPVRRTYASFALHGAAATVPLLGVPARGLGLIHGWRTSDGSASLAALARGLRAPGPVRTPGPELVPGTLALSVGVQANGGAAVLTADLRRPDGTVRSLALGTAGAQRQIVTARVPAGRFELEALTLTPPTGLEITNGHQRAESPATVTESAATVSIGPLRLLGARPQTVPISAWRATGAATNVGRAPGRLRIRFSPAGNPGVIRPAQPSDATPLSVLADPATATASAGGRLTLSVDGLPVSARVVGTVRRFPTVPTDSGGFILADEAALAGALDASLPGAGRPDELWLTSGRLGVLRAALSHPPLSGLQASYRGQLQNGLAADPISRGVLGTLIAAAGVAVALAVIGLLVALLGAMRDPRAERALAVLGLGPGALRRELALRLATAAGLGLLAGLVLAVAMTGLAVGAVRAASTFTPALIAIVPWHDLGLLALAAVTLFAAATWLATMFVNPGGRS